MARWPTPGRPEALANKAEGKGAKTWPSPVRNEKGRDCSGLCLGLPLRLPKSQRLARFQGRLGLVLAGGVGLDLAPRLGVGHGVRPSSGSSPRFYDIQIRFLRVAFQ